MDPASVKLTIDGKVVALTSKKTVDATDFTYAAATPFTPGSAHIYSIAVKDTLGNTVTDQGNFKIAVVKIGLNFGADEPTEAAGSALLAADVAGVPAVAQANWNNLSMLTNPTDANGVSVPAPVLSDAGAGTSVTVEWDSNNTWASTGKGEENNKFPDGPDHTLMTGYLDTDAATTSHVKIAGIPDALTGGGYDFYVYLLGGTPNKGGGYRVVDSAGAVLKDYVLADCDVNPTSYNEVPQNLAAGVHGVGNYLVFKGLKAAGITLEATTVAPYGTGTGPRAPVNAVQLVPSASSAPPPPLGLLAIQLSGGQIKISWTDTGVVLQQSTDLKTWTDVAAAASPYTPTPGAGAHFYRLKK